MLKSKIYCNGFASDTDKILGGGGACDPPPGPDIAKATAKMMQYSVQTTQ